MAEQEKSRKYVYVEAANGMTVRVPLDKYAEWKAAQERLKQGDPEELEKTRQMAEKIKAAFENSAPDDSLKCAFCAKPIPNDSSYCPYCGHNVKICKHCNKTVPEDSLFCPFCGNSIDQAPNSRTSKNELRANGRLEKDLQELKCSSVKSTEKKTQDPKGNGRTHIVILACVLICAVIAGILLLIQYAEKSASSSSDNTIIEKSDMLDYRTVGAKVETNIISIQPIKRVNLEHPNSDVADSFICECKTTSDEYIWVIINAEDYQHSFDADASISISSKLPSVLSIPSTRIQGIIILGDNMIPNISNEVQRQKLLLIDEIG